MSEARRLKSRTGCLQCKRRKVKCDERLPACQQCCRQKLRCPGYQKPLKWKDGPQGLKSVYSQTGRRLDQSSLKSQDSRFLFDSALFHMQLPHLSKSLHDQPSALIDYYFTRICKIAGCFDSAYNPFRSVPASMMTHSEPVYLLLQASSAVHLSRQHSDLRITALNLQSEAFSAVRNDIGKLREPTGSIVSDELMLSSIIAGLTSAWYDVNDLGSSHILGGQVLLFLWLTPQRKRLNYQQTFILGTFVYWLMISAFVVGDPKASFDYQEALQVMIRDLDMSHDIDDDTSVPPKLRKFIPHPLSGFSTNLLICVGKVGSLCRMQQCGMGGTLHDFLDEKARIVEVELLDLIQYRQSTFADPQDPQTTVDEILSVGEAYRCAGLLQLYTTFPQLLLRHIQSPASTRAETKLALGMRATRLKSTGNFTPLQHNWLRALAFHILKILETVPARSGTRVIQGLVVLIAASWLVDPMNETPSTSNDKSTRVLFEHPQLPLTESSVSKERWREVVQSGLRLHNEQVDLEQVSRVLEIVKEIWRLDDLGASKCDWMVVVASRGLQTLYG